MDPILGSSSVWVTPQIRELIQGSLIRCTVQGCNSTFKNGGNLQMHLDKHHKIAKGPVCPKLFFCPQRECMYNAKSATKKHFKSLKYLRQHFQKVHAEKIFKCSKCSKSFGTAPMRDFHVRNCGKDFSCNECEWSYGSSEALLTHAKRKGHKVNKKTNENSHKVAIPRMRNKTLASIVLEVTIGSDENAGGGEDMDPADYADILEIPGDTETQETTETSETTKCKEDPTTSHSDEPADSVSGGRSLNTPPPYTGDENSENPCETPEDAEVAKITNLSPSRSPERVASPSFSRVLTPPPRPVPVEAKKSPKALPSSPRSQESSEKAKPTDHSSDPPGHKSFSQDHCPEPVIRRHYGLATPPHCPEPPDSTGYSESLKTPLHHPASLDSTIYCPGLSTPLHRPEPVDPTNYSICLATPQHCQESDDDNSNYSRDLETPPCIEAEDSVHFSPVKENTQYSAVGRTGVGESSKYSGGLETPPHCTDVEDTVTFAPPTRLPPSTVAVETSNCIETQTESDPICIALPPKKRLKVLITPPLNHFTEPPFCHIETQTEFDLRTGPGDPMLYTDMHTQTCHEFLTELGLSNIQTQTNWPANDMDDGIQLSSTNSKRFSSGAYDELMVSTETQTSSTQCLLESCNEEDSLSGCITQHTQTCDFLLEGLFGGGNNDLIGGFHSSLRLDCFRAENNDR